MEDKVTMDELILNVTEWAYEKGLLKRDNADKQFMKVIEELGETAAAVLKNKESETEDGLGDVFVTLIILTTQLGYTPQECLLAAWNEIKDRKGKTKDGIFIKESDQ
jgi:NTP pyrophosphatase (non-canonical NTP hydrolase)